MTDERSLFLWELCWIDIGEIMELAMRATSLHSVPLNGDFNVVVRLDCSNSDRVFVVILWLGRLQKSADLWYWASF